MRMPAARRSRYRLGLAALTVVALLGDLAARPAPAQPQPPDDWQLQRQRMVDNEIVTAGVRNERVLKAMLDTPRHEFVPPLRRRYAYLDMPLPIGHGQSISPPVVVARMTELLDPQPLDRVLEIGTGSGYQAAVLSPLVARVYTIELVDSLAQESADTLHRLGYQNIEVRAGDGYEGWPEQAPFDKIIVTCSPEQVPVPLVDQLKEGGRMLVPLGDRYQQSLYAFTRHEGRLVAESVEPTFFVPMEGKAEERRSKENDSALPELVGGDFEQTLDNGTLPNGWFYVRRASVEKDQTAPQGESVLTFSNKHPGQSCRALQAMGIDGRAAGQLVVSFWSRADDLHPAPLPAPPPCLVVTFFDEARLPIDAHASPPLSGNFSWQQSRYHVDVPHRARGMLIAIDLHGGTGRLSIDDVQLKVRP